MNEHIEYWRGWSAAHLRWVDSRFDQIAADVVKEHSAPPRNQMMITIVSTSPMYPTPTRILLK